MSNHNDQCKCGHIRGEHHIPASSSMPCICMGDDGACDCSVFDQNYEIEQELIKGFDFWL
jgi:hypothetical protein